MQLRTTYKGKSFEASIQPNGTILFNGDAYHSLSAAAGVARRSVIGNPPTHGQHRTYPQTNGWLFWKYYDANTARMEKIDHLRRQYLCGND